MLTVLPHLVGTELEFVALAPANSPLAAALQSQGVPIVPFAVEHSGGERKARIADELLAAVRRVDPDLVHANSLSMGRLTGSVADRLPISCTAHLRDIVGLSAAAVAQLNGNRRLAAVAQAVRDFHAAQGVEFARMQVIYNGIEARDRNLAISSGTLRRELGLPPSAVLVASIGQICLRKGQDVFAQACALAAREIPQAHFVLVGARYSTKIESAAYDESLDFQFGMAGLKERFHRLGQRSDVDSLLMEIDMLVHSARQEPFGRVLLEAAAAGRPILATAVGGTAEMLDNGESAILVPPDDPPALAQGMIRLVRDVQLRARLGTAAHERVTKHFPVARSALVLADFWRSAME